MSGGGGLRGTGGSEGTGGLERLAAEVVGALIERGQTVATAESITAGGVCAMLTTVAGSSAAVRGGLIVYSDDLKVGLAGVPHELIAEKGAVDPDVAVLLAEAARDRCGADWGLGLTGVAGPGQADGIPAGTVYIGVVGPTVCRCSMLRSQRDRAGVRAASIERALVMLREHLG